MSLLSGFQRGVETSDLINESRAFFLQGGVRDFV
jgi:hypothetical protein